MILRRATTSDINSIVSIHCEAFKGFFLTSLGPKFLEFYYTCFVKNDETVTVVAEEDDLIIGFAALTKKSKGFNGRLIKNNMVAFFILSIKLLFSSPGSLIRLLRNITKKDKGFEDDEDYAELYSIGVNISAQGKGIGKKLLAYSEQVMKDDFVKHLSLTTDYYNNDSAVGFYHSMGYMTMYEFDTYPNRKMYRLIKKL